MMKYKRRLKGNRPIIETSRKPKYALKKLSVGVVSCLLGCAIYLGAGITVNAEETTPPVTTEISSTVETDGSEELPTDNGATQPQPANEVETVEANETSETNTANPTTESVTSEIDSEVASESTTDVAEERNAETASQPTEEGTSDTEEMVTATEANTGLKKEWTVLEETPTNKSEVEAEAEVTNPEVPNEITVSKKKVNIENIRLIQIKINILLRL